MPIAAEMAIVHHVDQRVGQHCHELTTLTVLVGSMLTLVTLTLLVGSMLTTKMPTRCAPIDRRARAMLAMEMR